MSFDLRTPRPKKPQYRNTNPEMLGDCSVDLVDLRTFVEIFGYQPGASLFDDPSLRDGRRQMNDRHLKAVRVGSGEGA